MTDFKDSKACGSAWICSTTFILRPKLSDEAVSSKMQKIGTFYQRYFCATEGLIEIYIAFNSNFLKILFCKHEIFIGYSVSSCSHLSNELLMMKIWQISRLWGCDKIIHKIVFSFFWRTSNILFFFGWTSNSHFSAHTWRILKIPKPVTPHGSPLKLLFSGQSC